MSKKGWLYTSFFVLLALVFYAVLVYTIPGFTKRGVAPISFVRPFQFINQDSQLVTQENVKGKVFVAAYFFTTCKGICPRMNYNLKTVYEELKTEPDFLLLSHTCDPETDSVPPLKKYVDSLGIDTRNWIFLTGRKDRTLFKIY